jgi:arylsulfatase A-like enzyme
MRIKIVVVIVLIFLCLQVRAQSTDVKQVKNVVFILADDLGWNDTNIFQKSQFIETPNIDALAARGMVFSQAYTNSPLCSPTRASILTGQTPARHGSTTPNHHLPLVRLTPSLPKTAATNRKSIAPQTVTRLDTSLPTLSSILKANDYQTAHFGKWHLGASPYSPLEHGFDLDIPNYDGPGPEGGFLAPWSFAPNIQPQNHGEHIDVRLAQEASNWIQSVKDDGPFFLNFWAFSVHAPFDADPDLIDYFNGKRSPYHSQRSATYAAMVKHFDDAVGILWEGLVEAEVEDNTIVIFTSDNGGNMYDVLGTIHATSNFPLRGGKATNYDGGIKVPTIIIWPEFTQPNTLSDIAIQSADYFPTLLNGLNLTWPSGHLVDGNDIRPLLQGKSIDPRPIFTYFPSEPRVPDWLPPSMTVTLKGWKLIRTFHYGVKGGHYYQLYDLNSDPAESINLAEIYTDKLLELDGLIEAYLLESNAVSPVINPNYREGAFNYETIGITKNQNFLLPEEKIQVDFEFTIENSQQVINSGETAQLSYALRNASSQTSVNYRQFMGPSVSLIENDRLITFVAPQVFKPEYVALAFIANDGEQVIRKQVSVLIQPIQVAPTLSITQINQNVIKGSSVSFIIEAFDANKDFIQMSVTSNDLPDDELAVPPAQGEFTINIPINYSSSSVTVLFSAEDAQSGVQQSVTLPLSEAPEIPSEATVRPQSGGSMGCLWLLFIAFHLFASRQHRNSIKTI